MLLNIIQYISCTYCLLYRDTCYKSSHWTSGTQTVLHYRELGWNIWFKDRCENVSRQHHQRKGRLGRRSEREVTWIMHYHISTTKVAPYMQLSTCVIQIFSGLIQTNYYMSCFVSHIAKVAGVKRNAAWCSFVRVHNVTVKLCARQSWLVPVSPCKCVSIALKI